MLTGGLVFSDFQDVQGHLSEKAAVVKTVKEECTEMSYSSDNLVYIQQVV